MSADQTNGEQEQGKVLVGNFSFQVSDRDLKTISESIGDVIEAQVILRGSEALGYGHVYFRKQGEQNAEGEIAGSARITKSTRGRGRGRGRGGRSGTTRRSNDDAEVDAAIQDIESTNKVTLDKDAVANKNALAKEVEGNVKTVPATRARGGRGGAARGAARGNGRKARPARGEPSKTLVFLRNLPYTYESSDVASLLSSASLPSASSITIPKWTYGIHKGQGKGFAFIVTGTAEDQEKVIGALNGKEITVQVAVKAEGAAEGEEKKDRVLRLQARQGYENEEKDTEKEGEEGTGVNDSGTAETEGKKEEVTA